MVTAAHPAWEAFPLDRDIEEYLADVDRRLLPYLRRALRRVPDVDPLKRGVAHQVLSGGKRVRAALCACSCALFGAPDQRALPFAAAIEHLQNFSLIHDDIADGDTHRRSQESIWRQFGIAHGVNIGDMFIALSASTITEAPYTDRLKVRLMELVAQFGSDMAVGQALDVNMRSSDAVTEEHYFEATERKTGAFLAMAALGGGIIGDATTAQLDALRRFALQAGVAFQIKDDLLDVDGDKGRPQGSDVREGKRTLLVIYAAEGATAPERRELFRILNAPRATNTPDELEWVRALYQRTGALDRTAAAAARLVDEASAHLLSLPDTEAKYRLLRLAKYLSRRSR
jgi:geranylgeranyl diphosphate synthase type I